MPVTVHYLNCRTEFGAGICPGQTNGDGLPVTFRIMYLCRVLDPDRLHLYTPASLLLQRRMISTDSAELCGLNKQTKEKTHIINVLDRYWWWPRLPTYNKLVLHKLLFMFEYNYIPIYIATLCVSRLSKLKQLNLEELTPEAVTKWQPRPPGIAGKRSRRRQRTLGGEKYCRIHPSQ